MEIREALCVIMPKRFAGNIALFLCFIPEIFSIWAGIELAWKARGGKQGLGKIRTLVFTLISFGMEKAAIKARALAARG
jgi:energy-coupling factor transporter transmembrane protein EcfT